jgi:uncharacterized protein YdhG (YjbR/CyaY superfamily)
MVEQVRDYLEKFPQTTQEKLLRLRSLILEEAPDAEESFAYGMPAYRTQGKPLVYFAGYARHIGFYATASGHRAFAQELSAYHQGKGSVQFPLDQPLPEILIARIVRFRVNENKSLNPSSPPK